MNKSIKGVKENVTHSKCKNKAKIANKNSIQDKDFDL